jgi:hypothetical protein
MLGALEKPGSKADTALTQLVRITTQVELTSSTRMHPPSIGSSSTLSPATQQSYKCLEQLKANRLDDMSRRKNS